MCISDMHALKIVLCFVAVAIDQLISFDQLCKQRWKENILNKSIHEHPTHIAISQSHIVIVHQILGCFHDDNRCE